MRTAITTYSDPDWRQSLANATFDAYAIAATTLAVATVAATAAATVATLAAVGCTVDASPFATASLTVATAFTTAFTAAGLAVASPPSSSPAVYAFGCAFSALSRATVNINASTATSITANLTFATFHRRPAAAIGWLWAGYGRRDDPLLLGALSGLDGGLLSYTATV